MNTRELFQNEILEDIKTLATQISQVQNFSGLLMHQQKIQTLYEKFNFLKQLHTSKYQNIVNESLEVTNEEEPREVLQRDFYETEELPTQEKSIVEEVIVEIPEKLEIVEEEKSPEIQLVEKEDIEIKNEPIEVKEEETKEEKSTNSIVIDFFDSIAFVNQLFGGDKALMEEEINKLNKTENIAEAKSWVEEMFVKYDWREKQMYVEQLSKLIVNKFSGEVENSHLSFTEKEDVEKQEVVQVSVIEEKIDVAPEILPTHIQEEKQEEIIIQNPVIEKELDFLTREFTENAEAKSSNPIKIDLTDSINFISQLFNGSKSDMDNEIVVLNSLSTLEESGNWLKEMYIKYNWEGKETIVKNLSDLILQKFDQLPTVKEPENNFESVEKLTPISIEIAEIKPKSTEQEPLFNPIKLDLNDSIAFISQLFGGNKNTMDEELAKLNSTNSIEESMEWLKNMNEKYDWSEKEEYIERLSQLITLRFES